MDKYQSHNIAFILVVGFLFRVTEKIKIHFKQLKKSKMALQIASVIKLFTIKLENKKKKHMLK